MESCAMMKAEASPMVDACGRPIKRNGIDTWVWNADGMLISNKAIGSSIPEYCSYDDTGTRAKKTDAAGATTYYFFPGYEETYSSSGTLVRKFKSYYAFGKLIAIREGENQPFAAMADMLGSTVALVNNLGNLAREQ